MDGAGALSRRAPICMRRRTDVHAPADRHAHGRPGANTHAPRAHAHAHPTLEDMAEDALSEIIPWFRRTPTTTQWSVAETLTQLWVRDPEVAVAAARMPMFTDPNRPLHPSVLGPSIISGHDRDAIFVLADIAEADRETALALTGSAWFGDGIEYEENGYSAEGEALQLLLEMAQLSPELTRAVLGLDWVADGFPSRFLSRF